MSTAINKAKSYNRVRTIDTVQSATFNSLTPSTTVPFPGPTFLLALIYIDAPY